MVGQKEKVMDSNKDYNSWRKRIDPILVMIAEITDDEIQSLDNVGSCQLDFWRDKEYAEVMMRTGASNKEVARLIKSIRDITRPLIKSGISSEALHTPGFLKSVVQSGVKNAFNNDILPNITMSYVTDKD